jgi:multicomponent Na+:H+ antiporter subunit A
MMFFHYSHVYDLAHGKNMVNVILVDFRGMDTLFESSVLGIAGAIKKAIITAEY